MARKAKPKPRQKAKPKPKPDHIPGVLAKYGIPEAENSVRLALKMPHPRQVLANTLSRWSVPVHEIINEVMV